jgi:hypothetical protein
MRSILAIFMLAFATHLSIQAEEPISILPKDYPYNPAVITPEKYFGFPVGQRHLYHHEVVGYLKEIVKSNPRVQLQEYAKSHGGKSLLMLTISAPENLKQIDKIRDKHLKLTDPAESKNVDLTTEPAVLWMGYGVHGNEPSATNVAPLVAYHLIAGTGEAHEKLLKETVILLDPCLNPDGFERFAHWANDNRGAIANPDPTTREHRENWPGGRTNYYWFDLNRDWLPLVHPESQGRLKLLHQWKPNVLLDYHEMGSNATNFFQPGAPKRNHPLIPKRTQELTLALAKYHAEALDKIDSLYFTEERFDDFYIGKGSTYADFQGCIGILFEQASTRGHVVDTPNGRNTFAFTIRNQFTTSLSSLRGTQALRQELLEHQRTFFRSAIEEAEQLKIKGYLVNASEDPFRFKAFLDLLVQHDIRINEITQDIEVGKEIYPAKGSYYISLNQPQSRLIQAILEPRTEFDDKVFYDISAWQLNLAFNIKTASITDPKLVRPGVAYKPTVILPYPLEVSPRDAGYVIDWRSSLASEVLAQLLLKGIKVRVATEPFEVAYPKGNKQYPYGSIVVPAGIQPEAHANIIRILQSAATRGLPVDVMSTGLTLKGIDLGSGSMQPIVEPKVAVVVGDAVTAPDAGQVWFHLDRRLGLPSTLIDGRFLASADLGKYSILILPSGAYTSVTQAAADNVKEYVTRGGTVLAMGSSISWLNSKKIAAIKLQEEDAVVEKSKPERKPFASVEADKAARLIPGSIFKTEVDTTHPLGFGFIPNQPLPIFRESRLVLQPSENAYSTPLVYDAEKPLMSGYASQANQKKIAGTAAAVIQSVGSGRLILIPDDPLFRGFWQGTAKLFENAVFFGPAMTTP